MYTPVHSREGEEDSGGHAVKRVEKRELSDYHACSEGFPTDCLQLLPLLAIVCHYLPLFAIV